MKRRIDQILISELKLCQAIIDNRPYTKFRKNALFEHVEGNKKIILIYFLEFEKVHVSVDVNMTSLKAYKCFFSY